MRTLAAFALVLLFAACQAPSAEMTEAEIAQIEREVMEWGEAWMDAWAAGTPEDRCGATQAFIHPDHVAFLTGGAPHTKAGWFDYCMSTQENWLSYTGRWTDTTVRVLSPDAAIFLARFDATWVRADETVFAFPAGAQLILVERTAAGWGLTLFENSNGPRAEG
jgi:hypothetical protein